MVTTTIRLGTASPGTRATTAQTLAELEQFARRAATKKIDLLLLPEAYLGGYPRGTHFGCVMGGRSPEGREEYLRYFQGAVDLGDTVGGGAGAGQAWIDRTLPTDAIPGSGDEQKQVAKRRGDGSREELERIARETGVFLVTGLVEKAGGSLYCSVVYVCPKLGIIGKRRKVMPTAIERLVWAQGSPATLRAVSTTIRGVRINLAAAICWENYMPLVRQALYAQNINLYLAPTADGRDAWLSLMRTTAIEGRCFVLSSNMCVRSPATAPAQANGRVHHIYPETALHDGDEDRQSTIDGAITDSGPITARRSSCVTEEGFEIALPKSPHGRPRRRQSVFDDDGNEIVLCGSGKRHTGDEVTAVAATKATTTTATTPAKTDFISRGGSAIVSPYGDVLAGPQWEDDHGIIYADVDFQDCIRGRLDIDMAGSYSRNDSFKFSVEGLDLSPLPY
ncbi:carbon-nitrogen hydrolase [Canariomyces notabilis]|uniref:Carbon-nitrogen hydrolase n=1 Tax=Canariomyces notabilis TaxID=2074819 RepID=A0AAN6TAY2_9PEZI|nr:carbon-nitrogen hydrolase [Canariomyces arenarius]